MVPGDTKAYATTVTATAKAIAIRCCPKDVGDQQPALFPNGSRRQAKCLDLRNVWRANIPFIDNFIFISDLNNQAKFLDFSQ